MSPLKEMQMPFSLNFSVLIFNALDKCFITAHSTPAEARAQLAEYCREYWPQEIDEELPVDVDDEELAELFFLYTGNFFDCAINDAVSLSCDDPNILLPIVNRSFGIDGPNDGGEPETLSGQHAAA
jgi:hypothetical protein